MFLKTLCPFPVICVFFCCYGDFTKMFGFCLNYLDIHFFINKRQFIGVSAQRYRTLLAVYDAVFCAYVICIDSKPIGFKNIFMLYHNSTYYIHPYIAFNSSRYSTLKPICICTLFLCSGFTSHMMSKNSPSIFNIMIFSFGISVLGYAKGRTKMATSPH